MVLQEKETTKGRKMNVTMTFDEFDEATEVMDKITNFTPEYIPFIEDIENLFLKLKKREKKSFLLYLLWLLDSAEQSPLNNLMLRDIDYFVKDNLELITNDEEVVSK